VEITLDIGEDMVNKLDSIIKLMDKETPDARTVTAIEMMRIGIKFTLMNLTESSVEKSDPVYETVLHNNELLMEILASTFIRDKSRVGAYDAESAVHITNQLVRKMLDGANKS